MAAQAFGAQLWLAYALATWSLAVYTTILLYSLLYDNQFVKFGPNASLNFLYMKVDDWSKWGLLVVFIVTTQVLKVLADEIISPWILNTVMDHKGAGPEMRYREVQAVCQTYYFFSATVQFVSISVTVAQLDLVLVLIATDLLVSAYTTHVFIRAKSQGLLASLACSEQREVHWRESPSDSSLWPNITPPADPYAPATRPLVASQGQNPSCPPPPDTDWLCPPRPPRVRGVARHDVRQLAPEAVAPSTSPDVRTFVHATLTSTAALPDTRATRARD